MDPLDHQLQCWNNCPNLLTKKVAQNWGEGRWKTLERGVRIFLQCGMWRWVNKVTQIIQQVRKNRITSSYTRSVITVKKILIIIVRYIWSQNSFIVIIVYCEISILRKSYIGMDHQIVFLNLLSTKNISMNIRGYVLIICIELCGGIISVWVWIDLKKW